ncbi:MAG: hypothetical protein F4X98_06855 [Gammaproteobacteria bacterium]|nr:hypothetical protein [Gammaproteobacteria bacterium]
MSVTAGSPETASPDALYEHPGTEPATELVEIARRDRLVALTVDAAPEIAGRDPGPEGRRASSSTRVRSAPPSRCWPPSSIHDRWPLTA